MQQNKMIKWVLYFLFLAAELFFDVLFLISLCTSGLYIPAVFAVVALVALAVWQILRYVKATDFLVKRRVLRYLALIMLTPIAVFFVTYIVIAIIFVFAIA